MAPCLTGSDLGSLAEPVVGDGRLLAQLTDLGEGSDRLQVKCTPLSPTSLDPWTTHTCELSSMPGDLGAQGSGGCSGGCLANAEDVERRTVVWRGCMGVQSDDASDLKGVAILGADS
eukprot:5138935-Prymnesium_polylepis.2